MTGRLVFVKRITRDMLRAEPEARFVFGDNVARKGMGGQAKEMRGEPNAIGVVTKWGPSMVPGVFFSDDDHDATEHVGSDLLDVAHALSVGRTVYFPADGIGTGLSELPKRAPKLHAKIGEYIARLSAEYPS